MDYIRNLHLQNDFQMTELTQSLNQLESEIIKEANLEFNVETRVIQELFTIAENEDYKMEKHRWDIFRFNIYTFIACHTPKNNLIPDFSKAARSDYGPLFYVITILCYMNTDNQQGDYIKEAFFKVKDIILKEEETSPYKFYSITAATYAFLLPSLINKVYQDKFMDAFVDCFKNIQSKIDECEKKEQSPLTPPKFKEFSRHSIQISYSTHLFFLEILRNINPKKYRNEFYKSILVMIHTLWFNIKASSALLPSYLNFINHILFNDKIDGVLQHDIERITMILTANSRFRHNDIFKALLPNHMFEFFRKASRLGQTKHKSTLKFICQFLFADNQREIVNKMRSIPNRDDNPNNREDFNFVNEQIQQYFVGHARIFLYFLEQLSASFGNLQGLIKQIKAIKIGKSSQNYIYFADQNNEKNEMTELDELLYSRFDHVSCDTNEEAIKSYEKSFKYIDLFQERSILPFSFFQKLMESPEQVHSHDVKNGDGMKVDGSNSSLFFNVRQLFASFFKLIVEVSYRFMLFNNFFLNNGCFSANAIQYNNKINRFDFTIRSIIRKIGDALSRPNLSNQIIYSYVKVAGDILFESVKNRKHTLQLVQFLSLMNFTDQHTDSPFYTKLVKYMLQLVYENTYCIDSFDIEESNNFHQFLLFILMMGRKLKNYLPTFTLSLREYQKSFISILLNRFRCTNQREFLNSMIQYLRFCNESGDELLNKIYQEIKKEEYSKKIPLAQARIQSPLSRSAFSDFQKELKKLSTYIILDEKAVENTKPNLKTFLYYYFNSAFKSSDQFLINKSLKLSLPSLLNSTQLENVKENQQFLFDNDIDNFRSFYTSLFKSIPKATREDSINIINSIPQLLLLFNSWKNTMNPRQIGYIIPRYQIDLLNVLDRILFNFSGKENEAINILLFLNCIIDDELFNQNLADLPINCIDLLICNLISLFGYEIIRQKVVNLFLKLHQKFLYIVMGGNYNYLLSLFFNVPSSYSEGCSLYVKILESFLNMTDDSNPSMFNGEKIVDSYFSQNRTLLNYHELLVFFTLIQDKWPGCIKESYFNMFLQILTINNPFIIPRTKPELFVKPFDIFIKKYIDNLRPEKYNSFLSSVIKTLESKKIFFLIKSLLIKRITKANLPTPFDNHDHLYKAQSDPENFYLLFYLTLQFGVQSNQPIPDDIARFSIDELKKINNLSSYAFLLILINFIKIILSTQKDNPIYFNGEVFKIFLNILNMINYKYQQFGLLKKKISKCLKLFKENAPQFFEKITRGIAEININSGIPSNSNEIKKIIRHFSLFPQCIQKKHLLLIFNYLLEFLNYPLDTKIKNINNTIKCINFFSCPDYKTDPSLKEFLFSEYKDHLTYFAFLIHIFVAIISDISYIANYTFFDSIILFCNKFKEETIDVIISHYFIDEIETSYDLLYELITEDETDEFFNLILKKLEDLARFELFLQNNPNINQFSTQPHISSQHPAFFNVLNRLVKNPNYANKPELSEKLVIIFNAVMIDKRQADNRYTIMNIMADSALEGIQYNPTKDQILFISNYIATFCLNSPLYRKWKELLFKNRDRQFYIEYFMHFITEYNKINFFEMVEISLVQLLKGLKELKVEIYQGNEINLNEIFLNEMKNMIPNPDWLSCAMGCFVVYFKYNKPDPTNLSIALSGFGPSLRQPIPYCIIHTFKIANILLGDIVPNTFTNNENKNDDEDEEISNNENSFDESKVFLPINILSDLIQHILYFQKFLDPPYSPYVSAIFRKANKIFSKNPISDELSDSFKYFLLFKIVRCKELDKVIAVIQLMPVLLETIPFSLVYSVFHNIDLCSQNMRNSSFKPDNFNAMTFAIRYLQKAKMTEDEEKYVFKFTFNFIREIFKGDSNIDKPINEYLLRSLMTKAKYMPPDLLDIVSNKLKGDSKNISPILKNAYVTFTILSTDSVDASILLRHIDFIKSIFEIYVQKITPIYRVYVESIFNRPELAKTELTDHYFFILKSFNSINLETRFQLLIPYITSTNHHEKLNALIYFWSRDLTPNHCQRLSGYLEYLSTVEQQSSYLDFIIENTKNMRNVLYPFFISNIMNSKKVSYSVKIRFLDKLPFIIEDFDFLFISKLYDVVQTFDFDTYNYQLLILLYCFIKSNDTSRLIYYQKLRVFAGNNEEERFLHLTEFIHPFLWHNNNLPFLSFIIIDSDFESDPSSKMDIPLIMLSDMFDSISADFMTSILVRIINSRTQNSIHTLLTKCLEVQLFDRERQPQTNPVQRPKKTPQKNPFAFENYSQIITSIIKTYHLTSTPIQSRLLYKSLRLTNDFSLFSIQNQDQSQDDENLIPDKLLLPHKVNDVIFGSLMYKDGISLETLSASAQFFLGNYEESDRIFNSVELPETNVSLRLKQIANDFTFKILENDISTCQNKINFSIFNRFGQEDKLLVPSLARSCSFANPNADLPKRIDLIKRAENCNILYFKHHPHPSIYERSRVSAVSCIVMLTWNKMKSLKQIAESASIPHSNSNSQQQQHPYPQVQVQQHGNIGTPITSPIISPISPIPPPPTPIIDPQSISPTNQPVQTSPQQQQLPYMQFQRPMQIPMPQQGIPQQMIRSPQQPPINRPSPQQSQPQPKIQQTRQKNIDLFDFRITPKLYYIAESCMPPFMAKFVIDYSREIYKNVDETVDIYKSSSLNSPYIVFSSEFWPFFKDMEENSNEEIKPIDCHGFFAVNSSSLFDKFNYYLSKAPKPQVKLNAKSPELDNFNQFLWPSFCFNIFVSSEKSSDVLFRIALENYLQLLTEDKPAMQMMPHPQNMNRPQMPPNPPSPPVVSPVVTMPNFLELASSARVMNLFSYSISNQVQNQKIFEAAQKCCSLIVPDQTTPHLKTWMPQMLRIRTDFLPAFVEKTENIILSFGYAATSISHNLKFNKHFELRNYAVQINFLNRLCESTLKISNSSFERARQRKIQMNTYKKDEFITMEDLDPNDLDENERKAYQAFFENLHCFNQRINMWIPFEYDRRSTVLMKMPIKIIYCNGNFAKLDDKTVTFTCVAFGASHHRFLVEKVDNVDNSVTFSNVLEGVKNMFKYGFASRIRRIRLSSNQAMELGPNFVMRLVPLDLQPVLPKYDKNQPKSWILDKMISKYTQKDFFKMRRAMIASFAAFSIVRNMFSLDQPKKEDLLISLNSCEFPFMIKDFVIQERFGQTANLIPEELRILFGKSALGELTMAIAAGSDALARHMDAVRSLVEVPLFDMQESREKNFDAILSKRDLIDYSVLSMAPPILPHKRANEEEEDQNKKSPDAKFSEESIKWIHNLREFVENSTVENFQRILYQNDFVQINDLNESITENLISSSINSLSLSNDINLNNTIEFTDTDIGNNSNNNNPDNLSFPFFSSQNDDDNQRFAGADNDTRDDQNDYFDLF